MLEVKRQTPGGAQYFVGNNYTQSNGTLNHSCHVVLLGSSVLVMKRGVLPRKQKKVIINQRSASRLPEMVFQKLRKLEKHRMLRYLLQELICKRLKNHYDYR